MSPCLAPRMWTVRRASSWRPLDKDGQVGLFITRTRTTGAGLDGAVEQVERCGWAWTGDSVAFLADLSTELVSRGLTESGDVTRYLEARHAAAGSWEELKVLEQVPPDETTRLYSVGERGASSTDRPLPELLIPSTRRDHQARDSELATV